RPPGQREMAALLQEHFEHERAARRARVHDLLSGSIVKPSFTPPRGMAASHSPPGAAVDLPAVDVQLNSEKPPAGLRGDKKRTMMIGGAILLTLGVGAALFARSKDNAGATAGEGPKAVESAAAQPSAKTDEAPKKSDATVQLFIQVTPSNAVVMLDGARLSSNPFQAEVRSEKTTHTLHASAPGYLPIEQLVTYSNDTHLEISLRPTGGGAPGRAVGGRHDPPRVADNGNTRPAPEPAAEPKKAPEPEVEVKHRPATQPRGIDEKNPYAQ
ncbi:MAG: PEGA domain-containing protein, partial [Polyangiaceae bacterium]